MTRGCLMLACVCWLAGCTLRPAMNPAALNSSMTDAEVLATAATRLPVGLDRAEVEAELDGLGLSWRVVPRNWITLVSSWSWHLPLPEEGVCIDAALLPREQPWFFIASPKTLRVELDEKGELRSCALAEPDPARWLAVGMLWMTWRSARWGFTGC